MSWWGRYGEGWVVQRRDERLVDLVVTLGNLSLLAIALLVDGGVAGMEVRVGLDLPDRARAGGDQNRTDPIRLDQTSSRGAGYEKEDMDEDEDEDSKDGHSGHVPYTYIQSDVDNRTDNLRAINFGFSSPSYLLVRRQQWEILQLYILM